VNDPTDGTKLANPLTSLCTVLWLAFRMTGIPVGVPEGSPGADVSPSPVGRITVDWNSTLAPRIGFGGVEKSVTRTVSC